MIGIVLTFTTLSYIVIFPALIKLRYSHPHVNRPYRVPGGMAGIWICGVLCTFWAVFASLVAIFPGFLDGQLLNDAGLPEDVSRAKYTTIAAVAIGIALLAGFIFYWLGGRTREQMVEVPLEGNEELAAEAGLAPDLDRDAPVDTAPERAGSGAVPAAHGRRAGPTLLPCAAIT